MFPRTIRRFVSVNSMQLNAHLRQADPEVASIIDSEFVRQKKSIVLIASENFAPQSVLDAVGSVMTNKYSEGYPKANGSTRWKLCVKIERGNSSNCHQMSGE